MKIVSIFVAFLKNINFTFLIFKVTKNEMKNLRSEKFGIGCHEKDLFYLVKKFGFVILELVVGPGEQDTQTFCETFLWQSKMN